MRMRYFFSILVILVAFGPAVAHAQEAAPFARMGFGARGIGLSNAQVADAFGEASPYYNPALAPAVARQSLAATAAYLSMDRRLEFVQFAAPLRPIAGVAGGLIHAGVQDIDGRDASGRHTGTFSTDEYVFFLSFGVRVHERVTLGTGLQVFYVDYYEGAENAQSVVALAHRTGVPMPVCETVLAILDGAPVSATMKGLMLADLHPEAVGAREDWTTPHPARIEEQEERLSA